MDKLLRDRICLVTGTSKGIGKRIAEKFAAEGATVYATARTGGCLDDWSSEVTTDSAGSVIPVYFDMTDSAGIKACVLRIKKECGKLDVLVNNAGMVTNELLGMISIDKMRQMFDVNVFGLMELSQLAAMKLMKPNKSGSIINISSIVGVEGSRGQIAYSASKGAVISITKSMAKELAPDKVRVNAVAPGMVATERLKATIKEQYHDVIPQIGMGRLAETDDIADACLYFASDMSLYTTGQVLTIGGAMVL
ncbi:SDR family NAD(P)-dependent oxidoreductase [Butyrivibrio sp. XPD2006]|uniref:SDR family NAD(P)-dependent oxidoreductase n=1 Tax=Butyrivibrio sp. XPD2006 TaxID=1280668 RepID=UPI0003B574D0|nr:SDR family oxidoreductase [Butyrivibrio sp. XPD2006]